MSNMEIATRYQPRLRAQSYLDRERNSMPHDDSGTEAESLPRRKFQRTAPETDTSDTFRKPSIPASAMRAVPDRRPSVTNARRRSTTMRENMRVPSGPREYPGGSPGKRFGSSNDGVPSVAEMTNTNAAAATANRFLPPTTSEAPRGFGPTVNTLTRASFGNPSSSDEISTPTTPAERTNGSFDFVPTVNFDDFQSRLASFDGPSSSLLGEFPTVGGGRVLPKEESASASASGMVKSTRAATTKQTGEDAGSGLGRTQSFSRRFAGGATTKQTPAPATAKDTATGPPQPTTSLRTRRQSTVPQTSTSLGQPMPTNTSRPPRKSVGPGMFTGIMDRKGSVQNGPTTSADTTKSSLARSSSLSKTRRTTMGPAASGGAELPRISTLTATTASRQAKVKSLQPPPRDSDPNTPAGRSPGKSSLNRAHTPSSSGNKRQSMAASGRASGLGARTISPTDARRLKRMSMMQAPPMPTNFTGPKGPPTPQEEAPPSARFPDVPRLAQPSPSLIPRKTSTSLTPTSARASPEARAPFTHSLSSKSSYQSLIGANPSTSRLPTPKSRSLHSSSAQYGEGDEERVPPVPAIPKAYESPKEHDVPFFSQVNVNSRKSSFATVNSQLDSNLMPASDFIPMSRSSFDAPPTETPRKGIHKRNQTIGSPKEAQAPPLSLMRTKQQPDPAGRRNNNLQPLRLPPLNLLPLSSSFGGRTASYPKPSEEVEARADYATAQTPEPKRVPKTPSTPMTASKASFWRKQDDKQNAVRSSTSHHVLRDMMGFDESVTRFFDDSDPETGAGVSIPKFNLQQQQNRSAITPFASGSLPKHSGEFAGLRGRPSLENDDSDTFNLGAYENLKQQASHAQAAPQGPRPRTSGTVTSWKTANETPGPGTGENSPVAENVTTPQQLPQQQTHFNEQKKEGGGLRRKLSLGWRRTSSKSANHPENKGSPQETQAEFKPSLPKSNAARSNNEMPPPKLPASATWSGEIPSLPSSARPSLDSIRRKSNAISAFGAPTVEPQEQPAPHPASAVPALSMQPPPQPKTRALHSEQPQAVSTRSSSWGNFSFNNRASIARAPAAAPKSRSNLSASGISAIIKDKDDLAADEEMRRLSQKRRDVDTAARESEEIKRRAIARSPMSPEQVLRGRDCSLNIFERGEIVDYEKEGVYFTGTKSARKIIGTVAPSPVTNEKGGAEKAGNHGYDDERGDYNIVMGDHLAYRYEVVDLLGKGSFGQVVRCVDHKEGGVVAIKIIRNKKRFHQQALVEVGILGKLRDWDPTGANATLSITTSFYFRSHLCIVTPCLSINLYELIRAHNFTGFTLPLIRRFSRQLLACLVLLQQKRIIHCDLKPENILLCEARKADIRVIDFGSSCREEEKVYTYIQSRFYRSPEVILGSSYGLGIDMWSFGCILAELWTGYPIFPGENEQEQLACIMEIFGPPDRHLVERCTRKKLFFDSVGKPRVTVSSKGRRRRPSSKTLQQALKTDDEAFIDFIARCLRWDPDRRLKPTDAINHPFITNQPLKQRPGIPEEARRAARVRSSNAVPTTSTVGSGVPSPVKRTAAGQVNTFVQQPQQLPIVNSATPRYCIPTEPPTAALRVNLPLQQSPSKNSLSSSLGAGRRHSSIVSAGGASAIAGSKRASNGAVLGGFPPPPAQQLPQQAPRPSLAQMAARESMSNVQSASQQNAGSNGKGGWRA